MAANATYLTELIYASTVLPATYDSTGFLAVTGWTLINSVTQWDPPGDMTDALTETLLAGYDIVANGARKSRDLNFTTTDIIGGDAGQTLLKSASNTTTSLSFRHVANGVTKAYMALVASYIDVTHSPTLLAGRTGVARTQAVCPMVTY